MRIIAGNWRGRRLKTPGKARGIRPTSDRLREALFNILGERIEDGPFIDLFAGTGAVGLEAASRGAPSVVLVDRGRIAQGICEANIEAIGASMVQLRRASAQRPGPLPDAAVVFADPPYDMPPQQVLGWLLRVPVKEGGCWCLEIAADAPNPSPPSEIAVLLERVYGGSRLMIYERKTP